jgi:hypothetical protein
MFCPWKTTIGPKCSRATPWTWKFKWPNTQLGNKRKGKRKSAREKSCSNSQAKISKKSSLNSPTSPTANPTPKCSRK